MPRLREQKTGWFYKTLHLTLWSHIHSCICQMNVLANNYCSVRKIAAANEGVHRIETDCRAEAPNETITAEVLQVFEAR